MHPVDMETKKTNLLHPRSLGIFPGSKSEANLLKLQHGQHKPERGIELINRMVPKEKKQLTNMLHEYIQAHKLKDPNTIKGSEFSLVTGQND